MQKIKHSVVDSARLTDLLNCIEMVKKVDGRVFHAEINGMICNLLTQTLKVVANQPCVVCGAKVSFAMVELASPDSKTGVLVLYASRSDGSFAPLTKDHIYPKSKGGTNDMANMQCMCFVCNRAKGDVIPEPDAKGNVPGVSYAKARFKQLQQAMKCAEGELLEKMGLVGVDLNTLTPKQSVAFESLCISWLGTRNVAPGKVARRTRQRLLNEILPGMGGVVSE